MKINVSPLVVAAAFGLLGPAALADEEAAPRGLGGSWAKDASSDADDDRARSMRPGQTIELIPVDDRLILSDDSSAGGASQWLDLAGPGARQRLVVEGAQVLRELSQDGDALTVRTTVRRGDESVVFLDSYSRTA